MLVRLGSALGQRSGRGMLSVRTKGVIGQRAAKRTTTMHWEVETQVTLATAIQL